jgi:hypothetical protein
LLHPGIQFKSVEGDALFADTDFNEIWPYLGVKSVAVHAQVARRIAETNQPGRDS